MINIGNVYVMFGAEMPEDLDGCLQVDDIVVLNGKPYRFEYKTWMQCNGKKGSKQRYFQNGANYLNDVSDKPRVCKAIINVINEGKAIFAMRSAK